MVKKVKNLDWFSCDCLLRWESAKTYKRADDIYIKLWGLIHTINTTTEQHQQAMLTGSSKSRAISKIHLQEKQQFYPDDDFPLIAFHPTTSHYAEIVLRQGESFYITLVFGGEHRHLSAQWLGWLTKRLTLENTGFSLINTPHLHSHSITLPPITPTQLQNIQTAHDAHNELTIFIATPANLAPAKQHKNDYKDLSRAETLHHLFIEHTHKRLRQWFPEQQAPLHTWFEKYHELLLDSPITWHDIHERHGIKTTSKSSPRDINGNPKIQFHQGHTGYLTLYGAWTTLDELWEVLFSIHLLGQRAGISGLGHIIPERLAPPVQSLWQRFIINKKHIHYAVSETLNTNDLEPELDERGRIMEENAIIDLLHNQLTTNTYEPQPTEAFYINKNKGEKRCLEQLSQLDSFVHRIVFLALSPIIDSYQSPLSLGYRKGYSRQMAQEKVQSLIDAGYTWVIEADIEAFFDTIPHESLWQRLRELLPKRDGKTLALIQSLMSVPFTTSTHKKNGRIITHERTCGLMQGSPLSPILANLYLAQLDDECHDEDIEFVRYADDILIFCRGKRDAHQTKDWLSEQLQALGLALALTKTEITAVNDGFEFLGFRFDGEGSYDKSNVAVLSQRKPIVISGSSKYVALNGGAIEIRENRPTKKAGKSTPVKGKHLIHVVPLRRISQLIIFGNHSLSSPLLSACAKEHISVHFVNQQGFQVGTMSPTSADYYAISAKQYQQHQNLKPTERMSIACDIVCAKINNYQTWIKNSYRKGDATIYNQLSSIRENITSCTTIAQIMGYEGAAAKACFMRLQNTIIEEQKNSFNSRRRSRGGKDRLNSLLNFGYYWLFTRLSALVRAHGLNPFLSYLHESNQNYETLVYDIMEPFRVHVDKTVLRLINRKQIQGRDFRLHAQKGWQLESPALHLFSNQLEATFDSKINSTLIKDIMIVQVCRIRDWSVDNQSLSWFYWHENTYDAQFPAHDKKS